MEKIFFINSLWKHENHQNLLIFVSFHALNVKTYGNLFQNMEKIISEKNLWRHEIHQYLLLFFLNFLI